MKGILLVVKSQLRWSLLLSLSYKMARRSSSPAGNQNLCRDLENNKNNVS